jgi:hypothetical protein
MQSTFSHPKPESFRNAAKQVTPNVSGPIFVAAMPAPVLLDINPGTTPISSEVGIGRKPQGLRFSLRQHQVVIDNGAAVRWLRRQKWPYVQEQRCKPRAALAPAAASLSMPESSRILLTPCADFGVERVRPTAGHCKGNSILSCAPCR